MQVETIGHATLYRGDAREVMALQPRPDAICSDPPYGQSQPTNVRQSFLTDGGRHRPDGGRNIRRNLYPDGIIGDDAPFDPSWLIEAAPVVLLWGAHRFHRSLPDGQFLVWDKRPNGQVRTQGCGEAAWINRPGPIRLFRHLWDGLSIAAGYETKVERKGAAAARRVHPTQKPVDLMLWCIDRCGLPIGATICDPYMGGGSTGIGAAIAGMTFVGVELEQVYFDAACRRIEAAYRHLEASADA